MPRRTLVILVGISAIFLVVGVYFAVAQAQEGADEPTATVPVPLPEPPPPLQPPPPPPEPEPKPPAPEIQFPIPELGECGSATACEAYCDDLSHKDACVAFGLAHGLIDRDEAEATEDLPPTGPGGCSTESSCRAYCEDPAHLAECTAFGAAHGVISKEDARKSEILLTTGGPGGCNTPDDCSAYCQDPAHEQECFEFAKTNGFISEAEVERIERHREEAAVSTEEPGPGGCTDEASCRAYCANPNRITECLTFAESKGFISSEEAERIRKSGFTTGPGGCRGQAECRAYCDDSGRQAECIDFAVQHGFMTDEEARLARKFAGRTGPGGCRGEQCREYCQSPDHAEVCLDFAAAEGLMSPEELARARKFMRIAQEGGPGGCKGSACREYCEDPARQEECFDFAKKQGLIPPGEERKFEAGIKIRKKMQEAGGPGGCRTDDECRAYCTDPGRVEECVAFGAAHGGLPEAEVRRMLKEFAEGHFEAHGDFGPPEDFKRFEEEARRRFEEFRQLEVEFRGGPPGAFPGAPGEFPGGPPPAGGFTGPGGCTSPSECIAYCKAYREECFSFGPPGAPQFRPPEGGIPPGHEVPRLRRDLIEHVSPEFLRPFDQCLREVLGSEERRQELLRSDPESFFRQKQAAIQQCEHLRPLGIPQPSAGPSLPQEFPQPGISPAWCPALPTVNTCPQGQRREIGFSSPECGTYYVCVQESGTLPPPPPAEDPRERCAAAGGTWDGTICRFPAPTFTPPPTTSQEPVIRCAQQGGTWDGQTCRFPTSPEHQGLLLQQGAANLLQAFWAFFGF